MVRGICNLGALQSDVSMAGTCDGNINEEARNVAVILDQIRYSLSTECHPLVNLSGEHCRFKGLSDTTQNVCHLRS